MENKYKAPTIPEYRNLGNSAAVTPNAAMDEYYASMKLAQQHALRPVVLPPRDALLAMPFTVTDDPEITFAVYVRSYF